MKEEEEDFADPSTWVVESGTGNIADFIPDIKLPLRIASENEETKSTKKAALLTTMIVISNN